MIQRFPRCSQFYYTNIYESMALKIDERIIFESRSLLFVERIKNSPIFTTTSLLSFYSYDSRDLK